MFKAMMGDVNYSASASEIKVEPFYVLEIEREHLVEQTLERIRQVDSKDIRKRLRVSFKGEEGLDAGGVTKEVSEFSPSLVTILLYCCTKLTSLSICINLSSFFNFSVKNCLMFTLACGQINMATKLIGSTLIILGMKAAMN